VGYIDGQSVGVEGPSRPCLASMSLRISAAGAPGEETAGLIRAPHQVPGGDSPEAQAQCHFPVPRKLHRVNVLGHRPVARRGLKVLPQGQKMTPDPPQVLHHPQDLATRLPHPQNQPRLGGQAEAGGPRQHAQGAAVVLSRLHHGVEPGDGLEVVVQHIGPGLDDAPQIRYRPSEVRNQHFDAGPRATVAHGGDGCGELRGTPVR
jgi:hypothetical protein